MKKVFRVENRCYMNAGDHPVLYLCCRDKEGRFRLFNVWDEKIRPKVHVRKDHFDEIYDKYKIVRESILRYGDSELNSLFHEELITLYTRLPHEVRYLRGFFPLTFEGDINWEDMAARELGIYEYIEVDLSFEHFGFIPIRAIRPQKSSVDEDGRIIVFKERKVCIFDIETHSPLVEGVPTYLDAKEGLVEVITVCYIDNYAEEMVCLSVENSRNESVYFNNIENILLPKDIEKLNLRENFRVRDLIFSNQEELILYLINDWSEESYTILTGHNINGGNVLVNNSRVWRNGFDLPIIFGVCEHLGIDYDKLSPVSNSYMRNSDGGKIETVIKGVTTADWLYWWKASHYGVSAMKIVGKRIQKLKNDSLENISQYTFGVGKFKRQLGQIDAVDLGITQERFQTMQVGEAYGVAPNYIKYYCMCDTLLSYFNEKNHHVIRDLSEVPVAAGGQISHAVYTQKYTDDYSLRVAGSRYRLPTKTYREDPKRLGFDIYGNKLYKRPWNDKIRKYAALVLEPEKGYHDMVAVIDVHKMYPNGSRSFNEGLNSRVFPRKIIIRKLELIVVDVRKDDIGYDQSCGWEFKWEDLIRVPVFKPKDVDKNIDDWLCFFRKDVASVEYDIYTKMINERKIWQKEAEKIYGSSMDKYDEEYVRYDVKQKARKIATNGRHGAKGAGGRMGSPKEFNSVTVPMHWLMLGVRDHLSSLGWTVVGGHTDSLFVRLNSANSGTDLFSKRKFEYELEWMLYNVNQFTDKYLREEFNVSDNYMQFGCEKVCSSFFISASTRYCGSIFYKEGVYLPEPEIVYRGYEIRKKNTSYYVDYSQYTIINLLLTGSDPRSTILDFMRNLKNEFFISTINDISDTVSLSRPLEKYDNIQRARACRATKKIFGKKFLPDEEFLLVFVHDLPLSVPRELTKPEPVLAIDDELAEAFTKRGIAVAYERHWSNLISALEPFLKELDIGREDISTNYEDALDW